MDSGKKILGLDLGSNSIGWALVDHSFENKEGSILGLGSRIIPMSQDIIGDYEKGNKTSQTAERTRLRGVRRLRERHLLRRERLNRVLNILGFLPEHYANSIDFVNRLGKFKSERTEKIPYIKITSQPVNECRFDFLFKDSFQEMLEDFKQFQPSLLSDGKKIPYDWTIYYLRKKALTQKISKQELSWILLNFNQKRGYYQLRDEIEDESKSNKIEEFYTLKVVDVLEDENQKGGEKKWYSLILENGFVYRSQSKIPLFDWKDKIRDFIVTTELDTEGNFKLDKEGVIKRSLRAPKEDDWTLVKKKTENEIEASKKMVGEYIYDILLKNPNQKINGKLVSTIERKFYKTELINILKKQVEFHPELNDTSLYRKCIIELYRNSESHQNYLTNKDFVHLFINDIIFYQRPLKSKKSLINNCSLEYHTYKDKEGVLQKVYLKSIPKSHPSYAEFRILKWIRDLKIYRNVDNADVTNIFLNNTSDNEKLYSYLKFKKDINQKDLIYYLLKEKNPKTKGIKALVDNYRWNYVTDKTYPCNETEYIIAKGLRKVNGIENSIFNNYLNQDTQTDESDKLIENAIFHLWHVLYSVKDKSQFNSALGKYAERYNLDSESFVSVFSKTPPLLPQYASYSEKAIKKMLSLMRIGKSWKEKDIDISTVRRIHAIMNGSLDESIKLRIREKALEHNLSNITDFQGLPDWLAKYIIYDRHSEAAELNKWKGISDMEEFIKGFRQHSLRNPIVEQIMLETLRVVKDIWQEYGNGDENFFDEIHIELGRELKNNPEERQRQTATNTLNENTNLRIKALLMELANDSEVENVIPYSPMQHEILKIYEEGVLNAHLDLPDDISKIVKSSSPTSRDLQRYKLWMEQKYKSPYTGEIIPLNKLFTAAYEIEHIIPQSRYYDDSFNNKVICESNVNKLKGSQLALEFIQNYHNQIVEIGFGKTTRIFEVEEYKDFIQNHYANNRSKYGKLLLEELPEKMIERQLNDTRFISKHISHILSCLVREDKEDEGIISKNIIPVTGKVTTELKYDWGLNDVWNSIIMPRFERLNKILDTKEFTAWNEKHQVLIPNVPYEYLKGFQKKRIDHRHHAMDALVVACTTRDHVNLLNNINAFDKEGKNGKKPSLRHDLQRKLRNFEKVSYINPVTKSQIEKNIPKNFLLPWNTFAIDAKNHLSKTVASFKQNLRVINRTTNKYQKWVEKDGRKVKIAVPQTKGDSWAIRKALHKDTCAGVVSLKKTKTVALNKALEDWENIVDKKLKKLVKDLVQNHKYDLTLLKKYFKDRKYLYEGVDYSRALIYYFEEMTAVRKKLNIDFNEEKVQKITDTGIQQILLRHLENYKNIKDDKGKIIPPETLAFTPEGIDEMNKNIKSLNKGKEHKPIYSVRVSEVVGAKFPVGQKGHKSSQYVEAAKGTQLFFAVYSNDLGKRSFESIPFNVAIERQKSGLPIAEDINAKGEHLLFVLSPNDLVYVPNLSDNDCESLELNPDRIYKMVSSTGNRSFYILSNVATSIIDKTEFSALNKMERCLEGNMIKEICLPLKVDKLGKLKFNMENSNFEKVLQQAITNIQEQLVKNEK